MKNFQKMLIKLRVVQYFKNLVIFLPGVFPVFLISYVDFSFLVETVFVFCLISSAGYIFNDICDQCYDEHDPQKRIKCTSFFYNCVMLLLCISSGFIVALMSDFVVFKLAMLYLLLSFGYSLYFKNIFIVDLMCIAILFCIRLFAGFYIFHQNIIPVMVVFIFISSLLGALIKRTIEVKRYRKENIVVRALIPTYAQLFYYIKG